MFKNLFYVVGLMLVFSTSLFSQNELFEKKQFVFKSDTLPYRILYPENYDKSKKYPVLLFLHGSGERGNDNEKQLKHGSSLFTNTQNRQKYQAIVVFPQCPESKNWASVSRDEDKDFSFVNSKTPTEPMQLLIRLLSELKKKEAVDHKRIYVAGLSMGGMGTFDIICRYPKTFAAAVPICGGVSLERLKKVKKMPIRMFHGDADNIVPTIHSRNAYIELKAMGAQKTQIVLFKGVGHNSWDHAFKMEDFLEWIFEKHL
jgi:predicted peptidase